MRNLKGKLLGSSVGFIAVALGAVGCISTTSPIAEGSVQGCPELDTTGTIDANVQIDVHVKALMQASVDLKKIRDDMKGTVHDACVHIATDLGAQDTWSALGDSDDAIGNANGTGACDQARAKIVAIMESDAGKRANFSLILSEGTCHTDFQSEADCEAGCNAQTKCDPGTVEERCEPGELSVKCDDKCTASSYCEGHADVQANCSGTCDAECSGKCAGTCVTDDGKRTDNDDNCHGKCEGSCTGTCTGQCKVEASAGISCGANVSCRGSCTTTHKDPVCETIVTPPKCTIDQSCFASCRANACSKLVCDPPTVKLIADVSVGGDIQKLVATINANLPAVVAKAQAEGKIIVKVAGDIETSGTAVLNASGDLDGKSLGCATAAAKSLSASVSTLKVVADSGTQVSGACSSHSH